MAKRGRKPRTTSLDGLVDQLQGLDRQRVAVIEQIRAATNRLLSGENPFPWRKAGRPAAAPDGQVSAPGRRRKRRKMSKEARERIAAAQRERWARQRAGASKKTAKAAKSA